MDAAKKIILLLFFALAAHATASAAAPNAPENRAWQNLLPTLQTHQAQASQPLDTHRQNTSSAYDLASECCLAAKGELQTLAEANITGSGKTVLGHYPGYIEKAQGMGASYFDVGSPWK